MRNGSPAPPRGERGTGNGDPRAEGRGSERSGGTVQNIKGTAGGHAAILQTDFERHRTAVPCVKTEDTRRTIAERVTGGNDPRCAEAERRIHQRIHCAVDPAVLRRVDHEVGEKLQVTRALFDFEDSRHFIHESDGQFGRDIAPVDDVVNNHWNPVHLEKWYSLGNASAGDRV